MPSRTLMLACGLAALMASSAPASALSYFYFTGGTTTTLNSAFNPSNQPADLAPGDQILSFGKNDTNLGLNFYSDTNAKITYTFLGKEAGFTNELDSLGGTATGKLFDTTAAAGASVTSKFGPTSGSLVPFRFKVASGGSGEADNGGPMNGGRDISIGFRPRGGFSATNNYSVVYAMFSDGGGTGDNDFDDMLVQISITHAPIPPAAVLFVGGLAGIGFLSKRRKPATI
ncbi:MAG: hypothetical protein U1E46_09255 [Hyphomicrobiales bacterium]